METTQTKKRILILNYEYPPLGGGAGNATSYLLRSLAKSNEFTIDLVTSSINEFKIEQLSENVRIHKLDIGKKGNIHYQSIRDLLTYSWKAYWYGKKILQEDKYDGIHAFFGIPCGAVAYALRIPYIVSLRGSDVPFYNPRFYWLDKLFFARLSRVIWAKARSVVVNSDKLRRLALKANAEQEISTIYNGVDTSIFKMAEQSNPNTLTIISTSRLIERKGVHLLIDAVLYLLKNEKPVRLVIIGSGDMEAELKQRVAEAGAQEYITFVGAVDHDDLPEWYEQSDVFALPSMNEGMSNSLLEAMASGLAIISSDTGGAKELVHEDNGIVLQQRDPATIANSIEILLDSPETLQRMKEGSRKKAKEFDWNNMSAQYEEQYRNAFF